MSALVEIVYDHEKGKLRAKPVGKNGWIRFPRNLREEGAVYRVDELVEGKGGSWIAKGNKVRVSATAAHEIAEEVPEKKKVTKPKSKKSKTKRMEAFLKDMAEL